MKFGGTSVADAERIKRAARRIVDKRERGHPVVAVLSARGKTTDELIAMAEEVSDGAGPARDGHAAVLGRAHLLRAVRDGDQRPRPPGDLADGLPGGDRHRRVPHQGADPRRARRPHPARRSKRTTSCSWRASRASRARASNVTTLGRGGSDTSAVARGGGARRRGVRNLHRRLRASSRPTRGSCRTRASCRRCPSRRCSRWPPRAPGVLQLRSVEYARNHGVRIHCRSSFDEQPGTVVVAEGETMEQPLITAVTHSTSEARVTLDGRARRARARRRASSRRSPRRT